MNVSYTVTLGALLCVLSLAAYVDRVYTEMGKFLAREYQDNIDAWTRAVEPRLGLGRESIALSASVLRQLALAAVALIAGLRLYTHVRANPLLAQAPSVEDIGVTAALLVLLIMFFDRLVPQILFARTNGFWIARIRYVLQALFYLILPITLTLGLLLSIVALAEPEDAAEEEHPSEAMDDGKEKKRGAEKEHRADEIVRALGFVLQRGEVQRGDVVEDEQAEAREIEDIAEQDCSHDHEGVGVPAKAIDVAGDERDEAHGDGAADAVAAGRDEHAEVRGEHEAEVVWSEMLPEAHREGAGDMGGDCLQREVDQAAERIGDGIDEPEEKDGEERGAQEAGPSEQQDCAGCIADRHERGGREDGRPAGRDDEDEDGALLDPRFHQDKQQEGQPPPGAFGLPSDRSPGAQDEDETDQRNHHAERLGWLAQPHLPEGERGGPDGCNAKYGKGGPDYGELNGRESPCADDRHTKIGIREGGHASGASGLRYLKTGVKRWGEASARTDRDGP